MEKTVLFVDDEAYVLQAMERTFRKEPFRFLTADSGRRALEILAEQKVQVVISDEQMPEMSGSDLLKVVHKNYPDTIRMMLTGQHDIQNAVQAINEGEVYRYFTKPYDESELRVAIRRAFQHYELVRLSRRLLIEYRRKEAELRAARKLRPEPVDRPESTEEAYVLEEDCGDVQALLEDLGRELNEPGRL